MRLTSSPIQLAFHGVIRFFAGELGVPYTLQVVPDLRAVESAAYLGNPALRLPTLVAPSGTWCGSLNICRELAASLLERCGWFGRSSFGDLVARGDTVGRAAQARLGFGDLLDARITDSAAFELDYVQKPFGYFGLFENPDFQTSPPRSSGTRAL